MQIEIRGLTRRFGSVAALRDVHCTIPSERRVALVGPNGSG
jgi:ABC-type branched-subunit amino acid transport system ATPase component